MWDNPLRRFIVGSLIGATAYAFCLGVANADEKEDAARGVVDELHNQLFAVANDSTLTFDERVFELTPIVKASYDFEYISRFVLRRSWRDLERSQKDEFISAFQRLSVANYANRFSDIAAENLVITEVLPANGDRVQVDSRLQSDELDLMLSYTLRGGEGGHWAIVNLIADGVSDLALRRAEYSRVFKDKGFDGLLVHVEGQISDLN